MLSWCQSEQMDDLPPVQHENTDQRYAVGFGGAEPGQSQKLCCKSLRAHL